MGTNDKRAAQNAYIRDLAERFDRLLGLIGYRPGALARFHCMNFVGWARRLGIPKPEAQRLFDQMWERAESLQGSAAGQDASAEVKVS